MQRTSVHASCEMCMALTAPRAGRPCALWRARSLSLESSLCVWSVGCGWSRDAHRDEPRGARAGTVIA